MLPLKISLSVQFLSTPPPRPPKKFQLRIYFHFNPCRVVTVTITS